jgi:uncharacterized protein (DUF1778 family)
MAAVLYLRMAPALRDALRASAAESGVSLNAFAVQALAAAAGPAFLRDVRAGGQPATVADQRRVLERPAPKQMQSICDQYVIFWTERLGRDRTSDLIRTSKDHDRVWAWYVGRQAELAALAEVSPRAAR